MQKPKSISEFFELRAKSKEDANKINDYFLSVVSMRFSDYDEARKILLPEAKIGYTTKERSYGIQFHDGIKLGDTTIYLHKLDDSGLYNVFGSIAKEGYMGSINMPACSKDRIDDMVCKRANLIADISKMQENPKLPIGNLSQDARWLLRRNSKAYQDFPEHQNKLASNFSRFRSILDSEVLRLQKKENALRCLNEFITTIANKRLELAYENGCVPEKWIDELAEEIENKPNELKKGVQSDNPLENLSQKLVTPMVGKASIKSDGTQVDNAN